MAGGLPVLEFTLRTPAALDAVRAVVDQVPGAIVGTGTVRNAAQLEASARAGAQAVSPGGSPRLSTQRPTIRSHCFLAPSPPAK